MELIEHTLNWCKGEVFEGKMSILFGILVLCTGVAYWKWSSTPYAKAMVWPLLLVAMFAIGAGIYLIVANQKRIVSFPLAYQEQPMEFAQAEKQRTADFIKWYPITQKIFFGVMVAAMLCLILSKLPLIRAIGIGFMLLAFYVFVLDHFSEERGRLYHSQIIEHLAN